MNRVGILLFVALSFVACEEATNPDVSAVATPLFSTSGIAVCNIEQVTSNPESQRGAWIAGSRIYWQDRRNAHPDEPHVSGNWDIYMLDLDLEEPPQPVTTHPAAQHYPNVSGNLMVYEDYRNGSLEIYLRDLNQPDGSEIAITEDPEIDNWMPSISGDVIVWQQGREGGIGTVFMYNLATPEEEPRPISDEQAYQRNPAISGDVVVWVNRGDGDAGDHIYMYDVANGGEAAAITTETARRRYVQISGDLIVWDDDRDGNYDIYLYDMATGGEPEQITDDPSHQISPFVSGNRITWADHRHGNYDIYLYDRSTDTESRITAEPTGQIWSFISGDRIAWDDQRNGNWDIYMCEIVSVAPASVEALLEQVDQHAAEGLISNSGIETALRAFLQQIGADVQQENFESACARLDRFIDFVSRKSGTHIETEAAQILITGAEGLKDTYGCGG